MSSVLNIGTHGAEGSGLWHDYLSVDAKAAVSIYYMHSALRQYFIIISELYIVLYQLVLINRICAQPL